MLASWKRSAKKLRQCQAKAFRIQIGPVAYKLELPEELSNIHSTFHVSNIKKYLSDESLIILMKELRLDDKLIFMEGPMEIMDREVKQLKQSRILIVKVRWNCKRGLEFTWEHEDQICANINFFSTGISLTQQWEHFFTSSGKVNSHNNIDDKGYWDSGYSRHMTGNISYLSEYEPYDGGYVSFGQGGGKITEIENLKDLKVKIIRCDNGGEFNNKEMHEFCTRKWIKREFINARTPQKNGVADRRNRTLIEVTRSMLVDAKHPVTFWAEAVNTACYVQNKVLVNNSQNKTPCELFNSRTPTIGFIRPFRCHVMILNTLDHLGKFDAKGDEDFLKNKLIEKGTGSNWLFDIDTLTNSMNYVPVVVAGTSSTNISGTKDAASQGVKKYVSTLRYIALPNWFHEAHMESSNNDAQDACNADAPESSGTSNPTATSKSPPAEQMESLTVESAIPTVSSPVLTTCLDTSPGTTSGSRLISKEVFSQEETPSLDNILTLLNRFKYILGDTIHTIDINGVEADLSNMESIIPVSPTPTFKIQKDHPKSQIIGPVDTPVQTRHKSKEMEEHSFIATIHQKTTPNLLQFCLFSCFLSQEEPKKIFDALKDPNWVEVINKARLVAQGHTQEEGINYEEFFEPVVKIEAIRLFLAYASFMGFTVYQMDVKSAFLYGTIYEEVYVMQPPGFQDPKFPDRVYKVEKAMGISDQTLFIRKHRGDFLLVQVYVEDIIFGSSNPQLCREFEALMHDKFQMSAMGELNLFLGLEVLQKKDGIFLSQDKYVGDILKKFGYSDVRSANTLMDKENPWEKMDLVKM
nr:hypothetical protein [Tanacetum cinerariifolium]